MKRLPVTYENIEIETYELAWHGAKAAKDPSLHAEKAQSEGLRDPVEFVEELIEVGQIASGEIALAHQGLAVVAANKISTRSDNKSFGYDDLVQEGTVGILANSGRYYPIRDQITPGSFFYRAARFQILHGLRDFSSTVRLPQDTRSLIKRIDGLRNSRHPQTGVGVSREEALQAVGILDDDKKVKLLERARLLTKELGSIDSGYAVNIDNPSGNQYGQLMENIFSDPGEPTGEYDSDEAANQELCDMLLATESMSDLELSVIKSTFGFEQEPMTREEIAKIHGTTIKAIQQIEASAMSKLRHETFKSRYNESEV